MSSPKPKAPKTPKVKVPKLPKTPKAPKEPKTKSVIAAKAPKEKASKVSKLLKGNPIAPLKRALRLSIEKDPKLLKLLLRGQPHSSQIEMLTFVFGQPK